jgi:hypothetical protein
VAGALLLGFASPAAAGGDEAAAEALFVQARAEMTKGNYAKACPMLEESYRIVAGIGTKFNLGDCYERLGLTASAWASFRDAAAASKLAGQKERESAAKDRAARLEDKLCRLTIQVASQSGVTVTRDGDVIGAGQWGVPLPIDPGSHLVEAKAPGKNAWSTSISTTSCPSTSSVAVPVLTDAPLPPPPPAQRKEDEPKVQPRSNPARSILTVTSLGLGVAGLGLGSYLGVRAWSLRDDSNSNGHCTGNTCDDRGSALRDQSRQFGTGATISFIAGGALLALGIVLWLTDTPAAKAH